VLDGYLNFGKSRNITGHPKARVRTIFLLVIASRA
jgi:hypothetical protein